MGAGAVGPDQMQTMMQSPMAQVRGDGGSCSVAQLLLARRSFLSPLWQPGCLLTPPEVLSLLHPACAPPPLPPGGAGDPSQPRAHAHHAPGQPGCAPDDGGQPGGECVCVHVCPSIIACSDSSDSNGSNSSSTPALQQRFAASLPHRGRAAWLPADLPLCPCPASPLPLPPPPPLASGGPRPQRPRDAAPDVAGHVESGASVVLVLLLLLWWCCGGVVVLLLLGGGGDGRLIPAYSAERWPAHPPHLPATPPPLPHTPRLPPAAPGADARAGAQHGPSDEQH